MPLDHSKATATISIAGLALSCINARKHNRCEIGVVRCSRHRPVLDIQRILVDPRTRTPLCSSLMDHSLNLDEAITIDVVYPDRDAAPQCERGTSTYERRGFDRLDDTGDEEDFRWVPDLEGPEFHNHKLRIKRPAMLKPTLLISEGILYTREKTNETFARVSITGKPSAVALGKMAYGLNIDITCQEGGEIVLRNRHDDGSRESRERCSVRLPHSDSIRYRITLENHCQMADESEGTDFRLFYDVLKDREGKQFDLRRMVETGPYAAPEETLEERRDFCLDGFPEKCMVGRLSLTQGLDE